MPRRPRIHLDRTPLHIVQRGHNRSPCFFDDQDRLAYLDWVHEALRREELSPVRAGKVTDPSDWPWSSYRANALGERRAILAPPPLYLALGSAPGERREAYRNLLRDALEDAPLADLRLALNQNQPLGNDRFYAEIEAVTGHRREPRKRGRPKKQPIDDPAPDLRQQELPLYSAPHSQKASLAPFAFCRGLTLPFSSLFAGSTCARTANTCSRTGAVVSMYCRPRNILGMSSRERVSSAIWEMSCSPKLS